MNRTISENSMFIDGVSHERNIRFLGSYSERDSWLQTGALGAVYMVEGGITFRLIYMQKFRPRCLPSGEGKEEKLSPFTS